MSSCKGAHYIDTLNLLQAKLIARDTLLNSSPPSSVSLYGFAHSLSIYTKKKSHMNKLIALFSPVDANLLVVGQYSSGLVFASIFISILAAFMALQISTAASQSTSQKRKLYTVSAGSAALGGGVWSMHFIGMLAFQLCTEIRYDPLITVLSLVPSFIASWITLRILTKQTVHLYMIILGGVCVGAGIGTMHYMGMAAMTMAVKLRYDWGMFALSIVVAVVLAIVSLTIKFGIRNTYAKRLSPLQINALAGTVMGCAIAGMHYTGMAAARFEMPPGFETSNQTANISLFLGVSVATVTLLLILIVLALNTLFQFKDITAKAKAGEARLIAMMETAADVILSVNNQLNIVASNSAIHTLLGWKKDDIAGQSINLLLKSPDNTLLKKAINTRGYSVDLEVKHKNGSHIPVRFSVGHTHFNQREHFVCFISDLRDRLRMEQAVRQNEAKLRSLIRNIPGIAYRSEFKQNWPMVFISDAVERISGYPPSDFLLPSPKRYFSDLIHPEDAYSVNNLETTESSFAIEYRIVHKDGSTRWVLEHGSKTMDEFTREVFIDGFIMDISDRKHMEQDLYFAKQRAEDTAESRAAFMANMSHEIRTPMNAIIGFSDILLSENLPDQCNKHVATINKSAKSLLHLLNDILDSAKLERGKLELELRSFSLVEEIDTVVSTLWLQAKKKGLNFSVSISDDISPCYSGAPERIRQVLTNLLSNAVKFTQNGSVALTVKPQTKGVHFAIEDTGIGMTPEQLNKVFAPFTQADASMSRRFGGTGLGTTISKQLVELMGGVIDVKSEMGCGSCFSFTLPLTQAQCIVATRSLSSVAIPKLSIVIADDIQQNLDLLTILLEKQGHKVVQATNGKEALDAIRDSSPDLVLMDIQMPVLDGLEATRLLRLQEVDLQEQRPEYKPLPVIALTASALVQDRNAALSAGMNGFCTKPIIVDELFSEIAHVLGLTPQKAQTSTTSGDTASERKLTSVIINERRGVQLWGNKQTWLHEVTRFIEKLDCHFTNMTQACVAKNLTSLVNDAHSLKGVSGNLGLDLLMSKLSMLESSAQINAENCRDRLDELKEAIKVTQHTLQDILPHQSETDTDNKVFDSAALVTCIDNLLAVLAKNEISESLQSELSRLAMQFFPQQTVLILEYIDEFEFERAMATLNALRTEAKTL